MEVLNKKGFVQQLLIVVVLLIVIGIFIAGFWAWSVSAPFITKLSGDIKSNVQLSTQQSDDSNLINSTYVASEVGNESVQTLRTITFIFFFIMILGFIMIAAMVRSYPWLIAIWTIGMILLTFLSTYVSNSYTSIYNTSPEARAAYDSWPSNHFLLSNLPMIILFFSLVTGLAMFLIIPKDIDIETGGVI